MRSTLAVTTAAADLHLLSADERRSAAQVSGSASDTVLDAMSLNVSAAIMAECNVAAGAGAEPTLKRETLTETFYSVSCCDLALARRHDVAITSITENGTVLAASDYLVDAEAGLLARLEGDLPRRWCASKVIVVYQAGFATVPADLKLAASEYIRSVWRAKDRDPLVKAERTTIPDVRETERQYWVGAVPGETDGAVPEAIGGKLKRYRNEVIA